MIIMFDERFNLRFEITGQVLILQQHAVLQGLVPALDLALCLRVERSTANVPHILFREIVRQLASNIAGPLSDSRRGLCRTCA